VAADQPEAAEVLSVALRVPGPALARRGVEPSCTPNRTWNHHTTALKGIVVSLSTVIALNGVLDLGIILAVAWIMRVPFTLDRREEKATVYAFAAPLPEDLAA